MLQIQPRDQPANKVLLALLGANFYVCAWDEPRNYGEVLSVNEYLRFHPTIRPKGPVQLHELDLYSVRSTKRYTKSFKITNPERCDTIVENAGIVFPPLSELRADGVENVSTVNCMAHFTFINIVMGG